MSNLTNEQVQSIYGDLLTTTNDGQGLDVVLRQLQDGFGDPSTITIATNAVNFNRQGGNTFQLDNVPLVATADDLNSVASPEPVLPGNSGVGIPIGTTAQRPFAPQLGVFRFNTDTNSWEGFNGAWRTFQVV